MWHFRSQTSRQMTGKAATTPAEEAVVPAVAPVITTTPPTRLIVHTDGTSDGTLVMHPTTGEVFEFPAGSRVHTEMHQWYDTPCDLFSTRRFVVTVQIPTQWFYATTTAKPVATP